ncbi:TetR/AcrR family transcriptional repressor of nem operon [Mycetocola sp. BIGb0189]|uniref:TetR/AcrR family transcriptional regulator n=1 Tax=Mycetocola sp. BIGb0189 TaxID=2940604 RepID=UPI002167828B|nr:TetR/AcrR family transcriptional regulator [Mycetocola sp. BIGb0189]MCS4276656.1 TetR/AcrR family transcriptional repressor of nem operon [Mycetocola sp. BIGb0189]
MRERGLGVSVADVMGAAGLTHGGFYKHFASKDELIAVSCTRAFGQSASDWQASVDRSEGTADPRSALVNYYLDPATRADPGEGCPMVALASSVSHSPVDAPVRDTFRAGLEELIDILTRAQPADGEAARTRALGDISTMVGALLLAQATEGTPLSDDIIAAAHAALLNEAPTAERPSV